LSALALGDLAATPSSITPNGDGQADTAALTFSLTVPANLTVEVVDASGLVVATVVDRVWTRAGQHSVAIDPSALPDGAYSAVVRAYTPASSEIMATVPLTVSRTLGLVSVAPDVFSPTV
jgi:hypothetical protein